MKKLLFLSIIFLVALPKFSAQKGTAKKDTGLVWHTDLNKANEISKKTKKPIFAFFTGSDWCGWCIKLQKDVFEKPEFIKWAKKEVVLLELDFPRSKKLSTELIQQNQSLAQTFKIAGYPTIWLFYLTKKEGDPKLDIAPLGSLGYPQGAEPGKEQVKFLKDANFLLEKGKAK